VKNLYGELTETKFDVSDPHSPPKPTTTGISTTESVTYMDNSLGTHLLHNKSLTKRAVTLHIYCPGYSECKIFDPDLEVVDGTRKILIPCDEAPFLQRSLVVGPTKKVVNKNEEDTVNHGNLDDSGQSTKVQVGELGISSEQQQHLSRDLKSFEREMLLLDDQKILGTNLGREEDERTFADLHSLVDLLSTYFKLLIENHQKKNKNSSPRPLVPNPEKIYRLLKKFELDSHEWWNYVPVDHSNGSSSHVAHTPEFSLFLVVWEPNQETTICHNGGSQSWIKVLFGELEEIGFDKDLSVSSITTLVTGCVSHANGRRIHKMINKSQLLSVSLHLHCPSTVSSFELTSSSSNPKMSSSFSASTSRSSLASSMFSLSLSSLSSAASTSPPLSPSSDNYYY